MESTKYRATPPLDPSLLRNSTQSIQLPSGETRTDMPLRYSQAATRNGGKLPVSTAQKQPASPTKPTHKTAHYRHDRRRPYPFTVARPFQPKSRDSPTRICACLPEGVSVSRHGPPRRAVPRSRTPRAASTASRALPLRSGPSRSRKHCLRSAASSGASVLHWSQERAHRDAGRSHGGVCTYAAGAALSAWSSRRMRGPR